MFIPYDTELNDGKIRLGSLLILVSCFIVFYGINDKIDKWEWDKTQTLAKLDEQITLDQKNRLESNYEQESGLKVLASYDANAERKSIIKEKELELYREHPHSKIGFIPEKRFSPLKLITSLFAHSDLFILLFNMLFFYLCGSAMEKHWGLFRFLIVFFTSGVISTLIYAQTVILFEPDLAYIPMTGSSGAIGGLMAGFAKIHRGVKVKLYYFGPPKPKSFNVNVWIYLGIWLVGATFWCSFLSDSGSLIGITPLIGGLVTGYFFAGILSTEDADSVVHQFERKKEARTIYSKNALVGGFSDEAELKEGEEISLHDQAWRAFYGNRLEEAANLYRQQFEEWFRYEQDYKEELSEHFAKIFTSGRGINFPAEMLYQWGIRLELMGITRQALGCFESALLQNPSEDLKLKSHLGAAELRIRLRKKSDRAIWHLKEILRGKKGKILNDTEQRAMGLILELKKQAENNP
jgi:membrane associated rhomboid family serine protease